MKTKRRNPTIKLSAEKAQALQRAFKPLMRQFGFIPHLTEYTVTISKNNRVSISFQSRQSNFTAAEVMSAIYRGKYPHGMTAKDLAAVPADSKHRKNETALHLALSQGQLPPKTTLTDLLECRGRNRRRAIFALFDGYDIKPGVIAGLTAKHLAQLRSDDRGSLLHKAALRGHYPQHCTVRDLLSPRDKYGMTPLHRAAQAGHLLPCTKAVLQSVKNNDGHSAWWFVVNKLNDLFDPESSVRNLIACPELCQQLRLNQKPHREKLELLLASQALTPELRKRMAMYPHICAAML